MAYAYAKLIVRGYKTFDQVPKKLRPQVKEILFQMGLDENGHPLPDGEDNGGN